MLNSKETGHKSTNINCVQVSVNKLCIAQNIFPIHSLSLFLQHVCYIFLVTSEREATLD